MNDVIERVIERVIESVTDDLHDREYQPETPLYAARERVEEGFARMLERLLRAEVGLPASTDDEDRDP